ncbi:AraC family ligand binding domain-containing protein, partial [bacterium]|nr:AraC family ligand binding domain-containing protein [bacterium]
MLPLFAGHQMDDQKADRFSLDNSTRSDSVPVHYFQYCLGGMGIFRAGGREHKIGKGQAFLFSVPSDTAYWLPEGARWERLYLAFRGETAAAIVESLLEEHGPIFDLPGDSEPIRILTEICREAMQQEKPTAFRAASQLYRLLMSLCERFLTTEQDYPVPIANAVKYLEVKFAYPDLQLEDLARSAGLSKSYFGRCFKRYTGQTPALALRNRRMQA